MNDYGKYCVTDVGFFLSDIWRFGKLYNFIAIAAQAMLMDIPCTIEEQNSGELLLQYDGESISGSDAVISLVMDSVNTLSDELSAIVMEMKKTDDLYKEALSEPE